MHHRLSQPNGRKNPFEPTERSRDHLSGVHCGKRYPAGDTTKPPAMKDNPASKVTNIAKTGGVTRSERIFTPESLRNKDPMHAKKDKAPEMPKRIVTEGGAIESLKLIYHSEYEMLDQLHKTLARVSLVSLLINSEGHHNLLLKVLNDAHVAQDIMPEKFEGIINNITASRHLSFFEDEIPTEGRSHNQPLHIVVKCDIYMIARVLIDNGSSLNVMPKATLDKLYSIGFTLKINSVVVKAFNGSKWEVMGEITLPICIGPMTFDITFQVMDIQPVYSCLLDGPWIHAVGAVPSSLHQKVKFIADQQLVSVMGEKELMISTPLPAEYVEGDEEALETSFKALEIVGTTSAEAKREGPKLSRTTIMAAKQGIGQRPIWHRRVSAIAGESWKILTRLHRGCRRKETRAESARQEMDTARPLLLSNANESHGQDEGEDPEEEALVEMERLLEQERPELQSGTKELETVNLDKEEEKREIRVGKQMSPGLKQRLVELLREYVDIFAWSYRDMLGLDTTIMEHKLPLIPNAIPVQQQLKRMKPKVPLKIKEKVEKQWNVGFLAMVEYPQWVANIMPVPKKDGKGEFKRQFPLASNRYVCGQHGPTRLLLLLGRLLQIPSNPDGQRRQGKNHLHHHVGNILLQSYALRAQQHPSDISKGHGDPIP
ncbi:hypothetical protein CR513_03703, partial [Mucuna pruriens]